MFAPTSMPSHRLTLLAVLLACAWWGGNRPAQAEDVEALIKRGVELRRAGRDLEALEQFRRANEIAPSPRALAQIGLAEQALGRWPDAEQDITRALDAGQGPRDPWIEKNRTTLEKSLVDIGEHVGSLEILGEPAGAEVVADGRVAGKLPLARPIRTTAGSVTVEVRAPEYLPVTRTVNVVAGQLTRESVTLLRAPPSAAGATGGAAAGDEPARITTAAAQPHEPAAAPRSTSRTLAWVALAAGSVSAATGVTGVIIREVDARNYNSNCVNPPSPLTALSEPPGSLASVQ